MRTTRLAAALGTIALTVVALAGPASAHVTIPDPGEQGGFSIVTLSVPNERDDASTTTVEVKLPEDAPLAFVSVQPKPGWEVETTTRKLDEPIEAFGEEYDEVVDTVTWSGGTIDAGQFDTFALSVGPLPTDVDSLAFPTIQTYSGGEEVSWIEPTPADGTEPEHPAPTLRLVPAAAGGEDGAATTTTVTASGTASGATAPAEDDDDGTDPVAIAALVVGIVAVAIAGAALVAGRRRRA